MIKDFIIRAEGLGKKYAVGNAREREPYVALRDVMARTAAEFARSMARAARGRIAFGGAKTDEFWALRNIDFEVKRGEVVGIVGRNGAGKSTLLKILSRITEPTEGRVELHGRVASLLEVGTGFHPELTGRENIFLNGAILGMTRGEIVRKFDEIVAFADVERFLDAPVKRYSSGMYVRLAFAVAAHLEPEILVVDEVLAVGDAEFQKKCLGKMSEVAGHGRTVLFVSHNMGALLAICGTGILLEGGEMIARGSMTEVAKTYRAATSAGSTLSERAFEGPLASVKFERILINGDPVSAYAAVRPQEDLLFSIYGRAEHSLRDYQFFFSLFRDGIRVLTVHDGPTALNKGEFHFELCLPAQLMRPGAYMVALGGRTISDEWTWGRDLFEIEVSENWSGSIRKEDVGLINIPPDLYKLTRTHGGLTIATPAPTDDMECRFGRGLS